MPSMSLMSEAAFALMKSTALSPLGLNVMTDPVFALVEHAALL
jgi:hypothetical protein